MASYYKNDDGDWVIETLGIPFGSPQDLDADKEWFSPDTQLIMASPTQLIPVLYMHGDKQSRPEVLGKAQIVSKTAKGWKFRLVLDKTKAICKTIWDAARRGNIRTSTGSVRHLVRKIGGMIASWCPAEISIVNLETGARPANMRTVSIPVLAKSWKVAGLELPQDWIDSDTNKALRVAILKAVSDERS